MDSYVETIEINEKDKTSTDEEIETSIAYGERTVISNCCIHNVLIATNEWKEQKSIWAQD
jgi:hypothetical protein